MNTGQFLKCDAPGCDHREDIDQLDAGMVGKPCPLCGASLLTQEDFDQFSELSAQMAAFVALIGEQPAPTPGQVGVRVEMSLHDGDFTFAMKSVRAPDALPV